LTQVELDERAATTLASLHHELLPRYVEHFEEDGALVLVMERIEGETLAALRAKGFRASPSDVQRLLADASRALSYLHGRAPPVVHRDLKPANVLRRPDGSFAFVDFGAVGDRLKLAGGSTVVGTFGYMAPEQFQGRASAASDVYGLGATALALLTGTEPEDLPHKGLAIDVTNAVPETTPAWLVRALEAMLEPDPDRRASSIEEALARGGARAGTTAAPPSASPSRRERGRSRRERRHERGRRRGRGVPFPLRVGAWAGLLVARVAVWLAVGVLVPLLLLALAPMFGPGLRRAAHATRRASGRAVAAIGRASRKITDEAIGDDAFDDGEASRPARVRVADDPLRYVRAVSPDEAQREAIRAAELAGDEDPEAWADRRATEEAERWSPPEAWLEREREREEDAREDEERQHESPPRRRAQRRP
jgi:hypothetical protein